MQPLLDYLSTFSTSQLTAISALADLNEKQHDKFLLNNPVTKLVGLLCAGIVFLLTLRKSTIYVPEALFQLLPPLIWAVVALVVLYIALVIFLTPVSARARILRDLLAIAVLDRSFPPGLLNPAQSSRPQPDTSDDGEPVRS
jgi:hypothetical protein